MFSVIGLMKHYTSLLFPFAVIMHIWLVVSLTSPCYSRVYTLPYYIFQVNFSFALKVAFINELKWVFLQVKGATMFFHIVLERNMQLHPRHFGRNLRENLVTKLMKDVEGTCRFVNFPPFCLMKITADILFFLNSCSKKPKTKCRALDLILGC